MWRKLRTLVYIALSVAAVTVMGCTKPNNGEEGDDNESTISGSYNGHDYVDLGLPSGTLWATCNVGATTPEDSGGHFAWGEAEPKTIFYWGNYQWCVDDYKVLLTKYCPHAESGNDGYTDNLTVLQLSDDAAAAKWGDGWCMPTVEQWRELRDNTDCIWTIQNDVRGCQFTAGNGKSIFLPSSGYYWFDQLRSNGNSGYYWSSSLVPDYPQTAWFLYFNCYHEYCGVDSYSRYYGRSIRPVRSTINPLTDGENQKQ